MTIKEQVIKSQKRHIELSRTLAKIGYDSKFGQMLRLRFYYQDGLLLLRKFKSFLYTAKETFGDKFFAGDHEKYV